MRLSEEDPADKRSASAANVPVRLRQDGVRLVDVDVLAELAHFQVVIPVTKTAQAMACSHADSRLVARIVLGRRLGVARRWRAIDKSVDRGIVDELLLRAVRSSATGAEIRVADGDCAVVTFLIHGPADVLALNVG